MHAALENRHKLVRGCCDSYLFSFNEKFYRPLAAEGALDNHIGGRSYLFDEVTQLCTVRLVRRIKTEISGMFANFATQLPLRSCAFLLKHRPQSKLRSHNHRLDAHCMYSGDTILYHHRKSGTPFGRLLSRDKIHEHQCLVSYQCGNRVGVAYPSWVRPRVRVTLAIFVE